MQFPPEREEQIRGLPTEKILSLAASYTPTTDGLWRVTDGVSRHTNGGQTVRTLACLPALTGQYGLLGGGLMYSTSDWLQWDGEAVSHAYDPACPPPPRSLNMNRLGAILTGEADPPIYSLFIYNANPIASAPNARRIISGLMRDDLFTIVHELFVTDTARYADIILPATSQLEHVDLHKPYGHLSLQYNTPAIVPLGETRSNWDVMRSLASALGFNEPCLRLNATEVIRGIVEAPARLDSLLTDLPVEHCRASD